MVCLFFIIQDVVQQTETRNNLTMESEINSCDTATLRNDCNSSSSLSLHFRRLSAKDTGVLFVLTSGIRRKQKTKKPCWRICFGK